MPPPFKDFIETSDLANHLEDPGWIIFDCRFNLADPSWGEREYSMSHIPGAIYAHLDRHLSGPVTPHTGRHPLPEPNRFVQQLSTWGVDSQKQVVVYDSLSGEFAARLWWLLNYYGHSQVAVLNGGFTQWEAEGRPTRSGIEKSRPSTFIPTLHPELLVTTREVERIHQDPEYLLIDARAPARFAGREEPIDPVAGHIPGAVNRFHGNNLSPDGTILSPEVLMQEFRHLIGNRQPQNVIVYCGSGVTSCHHVLAMYRAGIGFPRLYAGSWSEWIRDPSHPIEREG